MTGKAQRAEDNNKGKGGDSNSNSNSNNKVMMEDIEQILLSTMGRAWWAEGNSNTSIENSGGNSSRNGGGDNNNSKGQEG